MPVSLHDRKIRDAYNSLRQATPTTVGREVVRLLAAVADGAGKSRTRMEAELARPGITKAEKVALVRAGMSKREKKDLEAILDRGDVTLSAETRSLIAEVLGRGPAPTPTPTPNPGPSVGNSTLRITGDQAGGRILGTAKPGAVIEAINLSTIPNKRLHTDDTFQLATADPSGRFSGKMEMQAGDLIRMRARNSDGSAGSWVTLKAAGMGPDTRNAEVALLRMSLHDEGGGKVSITNMNPSRPVSEPGAKLRFVNKRTGAATDFVMNSEGTFAANCSLPGRAGDIFSVRATDGVNDTALSQEVGTVVVPKSGTTTNGVDLPDPSLHKDELNKDGTPRYTTVRYSGPLFVNGVSVDDVRQGMLGDCYFPSAIAAIVAASEHSDPGLFSRVMKQNADGTYTVTFKEYDWRTRGYKDVPITVDGDLYTRSWGGPLYGSTAGPTAPTKMEMWFPLLEKAYAVWKGNSYNAIGSGGSSSSVFEAILGRPSDDLSIKYSNADAVWQKITSNFDAHKPLSAGTYPESQKALYTNTGLYADHSYSVIGYEKKNGVRYVKLRNPWGESEPFPGDGKNDGKFSLPLDKFMKLFSTVYGVK